jgi:hypothetical protein
MHDRVIVQTLLDIQNLLWANLSDDRMISCLRAVIAEPKVQDALERGSDTALCFVLRAANQILLSEGVRLRLTVTKLWELMDQPEVNRALSPKQTGP